MNQDNFFEMLSRALVGMAVATTAALRITVILVAAWVLVSVLRRAVRAFRARLADRKSVV